MKRACGLTLGMLLASLLVLALAMLSGCASTLPVFRDRPVLIACPAVIQPRQADRLTDFPKLPARRDADGEPIEPSYWEMRDYAYALLDYIEILFERADLTAAACDAWLKAQAKP